MRRPCQPLLDCLTRPQALFGLDLAAWDRLLRQARAGLVLARLAQWVHDSGQDDRLPERVRPHFAAARRIAERQTRALAWEARKLDQALAAKGLQAVLLKGAAYALADLPAARGRLFGDIDILVDKARIGATEAALLLKGWHPAQQTEYDARYYRRWMHELPPLTHLRRGSTLDVHHNLLPETARLRTRPELVLAASRPLPGYQSLRVPSLEDLVLHSATHLFHEGEWDHGLRDLADLDALLRHGAATRTDWWPGLMQRAEELNLTGPLALALRYGQRLLATPVPADVLAAASRAHSRMGWAWLDGLFPRGLLSFHPQCHLSATPLATFVLYVRAHALRMPPHLLAYHLSHKAWQGWRQARDAE